MQFNPLQRQVERELFPCLRELGIKFYAYNPIVSANTTFFSMNMPRLRFYTTLTVYTLFSIIHRLEDSSLETIQSTLKSRMEADSTLKRFLALSTILLPHHFSVLYLPFGIVFSQMFILPSHSYREQYWIPLYFDAVKELKAAAATHDIHLLDASIRWMNHHSGLGPNDGLIFGANDRTEDLRQNLISAQTGGPLPKDLVAAFEAAWNKVKAANQTYFRRDVRYLRQE